jgi:hypothetical protein
MDRSLLDRVKDTLGRMHSSDPNVAADWGVPFRPEPCLTEPDIQAWEAANGVVLPHEYRLILLEVGNGGQMAYSDYRDFEVWPLGMKRDVLKMGTFPITGVGSANDLPGGESRVRRVAPDCSRNWPSTGKKGGRCQVVCTSGRTLVATKFSW